jgi:hypothetical protein
MKLYFLEVSILIYLKHFFVVCLYVHAHYCDVQNEQFPFIYSIRYGNMGRSSSVSDVGRYIVFRKLLDSNLNILVLSVFVCRLEIQTYSHVSGVP